MKNDETGQLTEGGISEFYVPATFQFSREPGRVERILVGLFEEDGEIDVRRVTAESMPEFFIPAVYQFSTNPGRIERFLHALFDGVDDQDMPASLEFPDGYLDDFYLPAANPDGYRRLIRQEPGGLVPASEITSGRGKPGARGN